MNITRNDLDVVCRTCLGRTNVASIFEAICGETPVKQMLEECVHILVEHDDEFPKKICLSCIAILYQTYCFKQMCGKSHKTLEAIIKKDLNIYGDHSYSKVVAQEVIAEIQTNANSLKVNQQNIIRYQLDTLQFKSGTTINEDVSNKENVIIDLANSDSDSPNNDNDDIIPKNTESVSTSNKPINTITKPIEKSQEKSKEENPINIITNKPSHKEAIASLDKFRCKLCDTNTDSLQSLISHYKEHKRKKMCPVCDKTFVHQINLNRHLQKHGISIELSDKKCVACDKKFGSMIELKQHLSSEEHLSVVSKGCVICDKTFIDKNLLYKHVSRHLVDIRPGNLKCLKCLISFDNVLDLKEHCKTEAHQEFKCHFCPDKFTSTVGLKMHLKKHDVTPKAEFYKCNICNETFYLFNDVYNHFINDHPDEKNCILCNRKFIFSYNTKKHIHRHRKNKYHCNKCKVYFDSYEQLQKHLDSYEHKNPTTCKVCGLTFKVPSLVRQHMQSHTKEKKYQCDLCGVRFIYPANLTRHLLVHSGNRYLCDICGKKFTTQHILKLHKEKHEVDDTVAGNNFTEVSTCKECGKVTRGTLRKLLHQAYHDHNHTAICDKCYQTFPTQKQLHEHMKNNHEILTCKYCNKIFVFNYKYKNHLKTHDQRKKKQNPPLKCRMCQTVFPSRRQLNIHNKEEHGSEQCAEVFKCTYCNKGFQFQASLKYHLYTHTGERPYQCEVCDKRFRQMPHLKAHMVLHTGEKPYVCKFCNKAFGHQTNLICHERIHTGETPYVCPVCNKGFYHSTSMKKHCLTHGKERNIRMKPKYVYVEDGQVEYDDGNDLKISYVDDDDDEASDSENHYEDNVAVQYLKTA